jgi:hypothetical protein
MHAQGFIAVTSRKSSGPQGKLMLMESKKQVGAETATGEESKMRGEPRVTTAASYPIVLRSYEPAADLDERLRRIFAVLSLPTVHQ